VALREILAQLDVQVRGTDAVRAANADLTRYVGTLSPAATRIETLRVRQQEAAEMASRLAGRLRLLQRAEGDNAVEIEEMRRAQLRAQGTAQSYGRAIAQLEREVTGASTRFQGSVGRFGGQLFNQQPQGLFSSATLSSIRGGMLELAPVIALVGAAYYAVDRAAHAAWAEIRQVIAEGDRIGDSADRLGITARAYQEWQYVAEQTGTSIETVGRAFPVLARNMLAGGHGATSAAGAFHELGVATRDAEGHARSQEDVFGDVIGALSRVTNQTQQAAIAQRIFGRSGAELLPLIRQAPGEVDRLRRRFQELGGGLSGDVVENADAADQALRDVDVAVGGLRSELVAQFLPSVIETARQIGTFVGTIVTAWRQSSAGVVVLESLRMAWVLLRPAIMLITAPVRAAIVALLGLFLLVEDFTTAMRGGRSVFGETWAPFIAGIREASAALKAVGLDWETLVSQIETSALMSVLTALPGVGVAAAPAAAVVQQTSAFAARAAAPATVSAPTTIHVSGATDPEATGRAVDRAMRRRHRELADTLAVAAEPGAA
jgi:hypothetical protein